MLFLQSMRPVFATAAFGLLTAYATAAVAQSAVNETPSNVPGISMVAPPPPTLDLQSASAAELAKYAIPPRPSPIDAPHAYARWQGAMGGLQTRETPRIETTHMSHGRARGTGGFKQVPETEGTFSTTMDNWSGTSVVNGTFSVTEAVIGEFVVPTAKPAFGTCTGEWYYSSNWPGIDGNGSNDVLQAGTESDAVCEGGTIQTLYSAWIEWYPAVSVRVSSPTISPGDLVYIQVWSTSATDGYAYFMNYSTNVSAQYHLTAPAGTSLKSNSVEWIVERPSNNGALSTLTNYVSSAWSFGTAWNYQAASPTYYYPGVDPSVGALEVITMVDAAGKGISAPTIESNDFLWFQNFGSSCGAATSPPC